MASKRQRWQKLCTPNHPLPRRQKRLKNDDNSAQNPLLLLHSPDLRSIFPYAEPVPAEDRLLPSNPSPTLALASDPSPPRPMPRLVRRPEAWDTDMIAFLAASRLCREEAMACSVLSERIPLDSSLADKKKVKKTKSKTTEKRKITSSHAPPSSSSSFSSSSSSSSASSSSASLASSSSASSCSSSSSKALRVSRSWGGNLKKILCKQFMPFSTSNSVSRILQARSNTMDIKKMDGHMLPLIKEEEEGPKKNCTDRRKNKPRKQPYGDENRLMP